MFGDNIPGLALQNIQTRATPDSTVREVSIGIITSTFPFGWGEEFLHAELVALSQLGCKITVFPSAPRSIQNTHRDLRINVVRFLPFAPRTLYRACYGLLRNVRGACGALLSILRSRNSLKTKVKNLVVFPTGLAVADVVAASGIQHIHAYWLSTSATVGFIASQVTGVDWSYSAHSWDIFMEDNLIAEKTESATFGRAVSRLGQQGILRRVVGPSREHVQVLHLGVAVPVEARLDRNSLPGHIHLICPAYLIPVKGHTYLLEALHKVAEAGVKCTCVLAGKGPLQRTLMRRIKQLRLENTVSMPGMINHKILLQQLQSGVYDAAVLASVELGNEFEGIPVSLIEAMALGIPCVATRTGAIAELIDPGSGILVGQRNPTELSEAIITLAANPSRRKAMGQRAAQRVSDAFNARTSAQTLLRLMTKAQGVIES